MRYSFLTFFIAVVIWAIKGFKGKVAEVEVKYYKLTVIICVALWILAIGVIIWLG
jgi:hypothetical protein